MSRDHDSPNHTYMVATVQRLAGRSARVLDYGCGSGAFIARARASGLDAWGADTYAGAYGAWRSMVPAEASAFVRTIADSRLPWPDASFEAVISNQVFEHMAWGDVRAAIAEVARVLRPGGVFLAMFPTSDVWFEGHVGAYFVHRLTRWQRVLNAYLVLCHRLGIGYHREGTTAREWAHRIVASWPLDVRHHDVTAVRALWRGAFGAEPVSLATDYMRFRLGWTRWLPARVLEFVCSKRAGCVLAVTASGDPRFVAAPYRAATAEP